jgi:putative ABC transport system permease protein
LKYSKYILRSATRNKLRSLLSALSVGICLAMMTVLYGYVTIQDQLLPEIGKYHRFIVMNNQGYTDTLPISVIEYVRSISEVAAAVPLSWYMGFYKDEKLPYFALATDPVELFDVMSELKIAPDHLADWQNDRTGCVVARHTAERRGWKIGEHIPLKGEVDVDLTLRGTYEGPEVIQETYFHWEYLEGLLQRNGGPRSYRSATFPGL